MFKKRNLSEEYVFLNSRLQFYQAMKIIDIGDHLLKTLYTTLVVSKKTKNDNSFYIKRKDNDGVKLPLKYLFLRCYQLTK